LEEAFVLEIINVAEEAMFSLKFTLVPQTKIYLKPKNLGYLNFSTTASKWKFLNLFLKEGKYFYLPL